MDIQIGAVSAKAFLVLRHALGATAVALLTLLIAIITHRLFLGPLSRIPGPRLAALSNLWYARHARNGSTAAMAKQLHRQYGPAVRVGPKEVWFNTKEAYDQIYSKCYLELTNLRVKLH